MKGRRHPRPTLFILLVAIVLASCGSITKKSSVRHLTAAVNTTITITKSYLTKRYLIIEATCNTTESKEGSTQFKFQIKLTHDRSGDGGVVCSAQRNSFSYYLPAKDLTVSDRLHLILYPRGTKRMIKIFASATVGNAQAASIYSDYVPPPSKPPVLPATAPRCIPSQISVAITGEGYVANLVHAYLTVSDTSSTPCSLEGWPTIDGITTSGTSSSLTRVNAVSEINAIRQFKVLSSPSTVIIAKDKQSAYSELDYQPGCPILTGPAKGSIEGTVVTFESLSVTLPDNLGTYQIPSSAFNDGSLALPPVNCFGSSGNPAYTVGYSFFIPSFGQPFPLP